MQTKNYKDFCPTKQTTIVALFFGDFLVSVGSFFGYDHCLFGKAEILVIFGLHFGRNNDLLNSFNTDPDKCMSDLKNALTLLTGK